jgi:tRNA threonylcarbamoyladenosine biosynthesis protein TsaE
MARHLKLPDEAATLALGAALAPGAIAGRVLWLHGDLGAGKTTLVRGLLRALGHAGRVKSPTYALVEPYVVSGLHLYHFDFYRFEDDAEWVSSGFREYFSPDALCLVEWPERTGSLLAPPDLDISLAIDGETRTATLASLTNAGDSWLSSSRLSSS